MNNLPTRLKEKGYAQVSDADFRSNLKVPTVSLDHSQSDPDEGVFTAMNFSKYWKDTWEPDSVHESMKLVLREVACDAWNAAIASRKCGSCQYRDEVGYCINEKVRDSDGGRLWVNEDFGCVYYEPTDE